MSLDPSVNQTLHTPPTSGRSSPVFPLPRRNVEDGDWRKDKAFRRYASGVDRALAVYDSPQQEWADYISFLGKLLKALQAHPPGVKEVAHKQTLSSRLALCMNPALPSGVHQKALEVYGYIFATIGRDILARDLQLYLPGIVATLNFASLTVRPLFLSLFETYILRLDCEAIRPALKSIILSLLPGLEEETSEDFDRVLRVVDGVRKRLRDSCDISEGEDPNSKDSFFWQCFFLATITSTSRRQGALAFLVRFLPKFQSKASQNGGAQESELTQADLSPAAHAVISPEPGLLVRCFAAGLLDRQLLVQRGFLDLLVTHIPLDSPVLQKTIQKEDLERLVMAATNVVTRRDMSLNRRLWAWFLGPEPKPTEQEGRPMSQELKKVSSFDPAALSAAYFAQYGCQSLSSGILKMIRQESSSATEKARPFRMCLSLMDRWEVGGLLVPEIFLPALESVLEYHSTAESEQLDEVMRSANVFFDGVESGLIWSKLFELIRDAFTKSELSKEERQHKLELCRFVVHRFNIREEEMLLYHIPMICLALLVALEDTDQGSAIGIDAAVSLTGLNILDALINLLPARAFTMSDKSQLDSDTIGKVVILKAISSFYDESQGNLEVAESPFSGLFVGSMLLRYACVVYMKFLSNSETGDLEIPTRVLVSLVQKVSNSSTALRRLGFADLLLKALKPEILHGLSLNLPFAILNSVSNAIASLQRPAVGNAFFQPTELVPVLESLLGHIWRYLSPSNPRYHVEAVRCFWQLESVTSEERYVEAILTKILCDGISHFHDADHSGSESAKRLATLWTHSVQEKGDKSKSPMIRRPSGMNLNGVSMLNVGFDSMLSRPTLILLDALREPGSDVCVFTEDWLRNLPNLGRIFDLLLSGLKQSLESMQSNGPTGPGSGKKCLYYLQHVSNVLKTASEHTWMILAGESFTDIGDDSSGPEETLQIFTIKRCLDVLNYKDGSSNIKSDSEEPILQLQQTALGVIRQISRSPFSGPLKELELETPLIALLHSSLEMMDPLLQDSLLETILTVLRLRNWNPQASTERRPHSRKTSRELSITTRIMPALSGGEKEQRQEPDWVPPRQLVDCIRRGFTSPASRDVLDSWVKFLAEVLPLLAETMFQSLIPLVDTLCKEITSVFEQLRSTFSSPSKVVDIAPEPTLISLMNGLEQILARAHDRLLFEESKPTQAKSPEQTQSFFGNVVGVFAPETNQQRSATANSRLTVLLCFQDSVKVGYAIWAWGLVGAKEVNHPTSAASFHYTSLRMRNRARRLLEHLFTAEALECLETLAVVWCQTPVSGPDSRLVLNLLNVLNGSRPRHTIPSIFNALYSRTNPNALDPMRMSTMTSDLTDMDLVSFLVEYTRSIDDDAMDEIWTDCVAFLKDVLTNPMPHRQILPALIEFTAILAEKSENTNFGEQKKMRKDLVDVFIRLHTAVFTSRPMGVIQESASPSKVGMQTNRSARSFDILPVLSSTVPNLQVILSENERIATVISGISTSIVGPVIRAKAYPENLSKDFMNLLTQISKSTPAAKSWKKDITEAFSDPRFFNTKLDYIKPYWLSIIKQLCVVDKALVTDHLSKISAPTASGLVFGVGATSARQEADRKTQLGLRRGALCFLANPDDSCIGELRIVEEKIVELFTATISTAPSSITRADIFLLLRAVLLKTSASHLEPLFPVINAELQRVIASVLPQSEDTELYTAASVLQACKFLDTLITIAPDEFQLHEWIFVTDTIDAVYRPPNRTSSALVDELAEVMGNADPSFSATSQRADVGTFGAREKKQKKQSFLKLIIANLRESNSGFDVRKVGKAEMARHVLQPFFGHLSIEAFEGTYSMLPPDREAFFDDLLEDLFAEEIVSTG
ncbi:hypothetical protein P152DRAFT_439448 [Eremomyces bilateralis CBS 781.70]|uniref:Dopey N-terminal domain-containing protein n=1 Tax=Eremomyces bilateralis CBS 781.70 TaxID=1392243 RepID=A0A6G1FXS8_9PEZI|nr:uncharacterized protein P152DRAFT_439448 [Eremomyces bilateralis CBS 781.70]KAF1810558.1 hypothetical protein P152DRAFT_439448 [Eremomyces bilateralis CBS 781.70]